MYLAQAHRSRPSLTLYTLARRIRRGAASWPRAAPSHAASPHPYTRFIQPNYCILYTVQRKTTFTEHTFLQHHKFLFLAYFSQFNCSRKLSFQQTHSRTHLKASVRFSPSFVVLFRDDYPMTQLAPTYLWEKENVYIIIKLNALFYCRNYKSREVIMPVMFYSL